jgi:poly(3-hydroxybutyrate) depolymerase
MKERTRYLAIVTPFLLLMLNASCSQDPKASEKESRMAAAVSPSSLPPDSCDFSQRGTSQECTITYNGVSQEYLLHIPSTLAPGSALMFSYGGVPCYPEFSPQGGCGSYQEWASNLSAKADQYGFVVAYPTPVLQNSCTQDSDCPSYVSSGNRQHCLNGACGFYYAQCAGASDTDCGYLRALISTLQSGLNTDPNQVFLTGFSGGAEFSEQAGPWMSDVLAGVAVVEGFSAYPLSFPNLAAPISVLDIHGYFGYGFNGSNDALCGLDNFINSMDMEFDYWTGPQGNNCTTITGGPFCTAYGVAGTDTGVSARYGTNCQGGAAVTYYELYGAGHAWYSENTCPNDAIACDSPNLNITGDPKQFPYSPDAQLPLPGITESDIIWNFLSAHPKGSVQPPPPPPPPPSPPPSYQGCYTDDPARALPVMISDSGETVETCSAKAAASGFTYAGVQYYGQCFGGSTLGYAQVSDSECNTPCSADSSEMCGGVWRNSIYQVQ